MEGSVGKRIKKLRKEKGLSVDELAKRIGKNRATVYRYEKDEILEMPYTVLLPLAAALDTTPAYLMGRDSLKSEFKKHKVEIPETNNMLAANLKGLRMSRHLSVVEVANELHIDPSLYLQYESGEKDIPVDFVKPLADYFGISIDEFFNTVEVQYGFNSHALVTNNAITSKFHKRWIEEIGRFAWTDEEIDQIINYAKFIKSQRKDDK